MVEANETYIPKYIPFDVTKIGSALTSVPCKRMFSKAGYTQTDRRNRLSIKNMKTLMFLNGNL